MADYFARASDFQVKLRRGDHRTAITALKFSSNQEFLGSCDDEGNITVRHDRRHGIRPVIDGYSDL